MGVLDILFSRLSFIFIFSLSVGDGPIQTEILPQSRSAQNNLPTIYRFPWGWSGGAMVLGNLPVPGRPTIWITVGQGSTALVVGAGGGCLDVFTLIYSLLFSVSLSFGDGPI